VTPGPAAAVEATFARRLRELRLTADTTQQQLADRMTAAGYKMGHSTISKIETGDRPVTIGEAIQFAAELGVDLPALTTPRQPPALTAAQLAVRALQHEATHRRSKIEDAQALYDLTAGKLTEAERHLAAVTRTGRLP
jgi:transcriptional regulator with XRE-family HTH domain